MNEINKNTYYMLPRWFIASCVSISRARSGKYLLTKKDDKQGFYLYLSRGPVTLKVPFRALFDTNDKIKPIRSLSFISALECPSDRLGLCQLTKSGETCYAKNGARQASGTFITSGKCKGAPCLNSRFNSELVGACLDLIKQDKSIYSKFIEYIKEYIPVLRFNLKGDFRTLEDFKFIIRVASDCPSVQIYGYTARDDILSPDQVPRLDNYYLCGSNMIYTNRFLACYDLKKWLESNKICLGGCNKCKKCYTLKNSTILCLVHGKNQDQDLNTWLNREFIASLFDGVTSQDLTIKTGLLESLNWNLKHKLNSSLEFQDYWSLRAWYNSQGVA